MPLCLHWLAILVPLFSCFQPLLSLEGASVASLALLFFVLSHGIFFA